MNDQKTAAVETFRRQGLVIPRSNEQNIVDEIYQINFDASIYELSNEFCKYYHAVHLKNNNKYFAIVFESYFAPDIKLMELLRVSDFDKINKLLSYSIVYISALRAYHLVAIVEAYDINNNLLHYVEQHGPLSAEQIENNLIKAFAKLMGQCEKMQFSCGNINASNIIMLNNGDILLREPIISYQHFYQTGCYLAPELAECTESGRITTTAADIYTIGVTVFYALTGKQPWVEYENIYVFNEARFENTTSKLLLNKRKIPERIKTFLRWTLHDNAALRWQSRHIVEWLANTISKSFAFEKISENTNLIAFNNKNYGNLKSISYAFFNHWNDASLFIKDDRLLKWAQRYNASSEIVEKLQELLITEEQYIYLVNSNDSRKLMEILNIIDPCGGIRQENIALTGMSMPTTICYLCVKGKKNAINQISKIIKERYWSTECSNAAGKYVNAELNYELKNILHAIDTPLHAFGIERIMYSLNQYLPCLSPMLIDQYVLTLTELLDALEQVAKDTPTKLTIDKHIIAFIAAQLSIKLDSNIKILTHFPNFSEHHLIHALSILNIAQQYAPDVEIPNLCNIITSQIIQLLTTHLHNTNLKTQITNALTEDAKTGSFSRVVHRLSDQTDFIEDYNGYYNAIKETENLKRNIRILTSEDMIFENAIFLGQKLTVLLSYVLCLIVTVNLIM